MIMMNMNLFSSGKVEETASDCIKTQEDIHILYHGSSIKLQKPLFGFGKADNDYGSGFYTTEDYDRAASWALLNGDEKNSFVNEYTLDFSNLKIIHLNDFGLLSWVAEILANRGTGYEDAEIVIKLMVDKYRIDTTDADVIIGYRADDSYTEVISAFLEGLLSIDEVERMFYKGSLGDQVFLKNEKAFNSLNFVKADKIAPTEALTREDYIARKEVQTFLNKRRGQRVLGLHINGITVQDVLTNDYKYNKEYGFYELI